jgi:phosphoribosylaminoimidazole carboxylase
LPAANILDRFRVPDKLTIISAHRTLGRLVEYAKSAAARGLRVIVAGVPDKGSSLDGVDSLHSIAEMPGCTHPRLHRLGQPTDELTYIGSVEFRWRRVAINNGTNAGLLAIRIFGAGIPHLEREMENYMKEMEKEVLGKVEKLELVS